MEWLKRKLTQHEVNQLLLGKGMTVGPFENGKIIKYGKYISKNINDFLSNYNEEDEIGEFEEKKEIIGLIKTGVAEFVLFEVKYLLKYIPYLEPNQI